MQIDTGDLKAQALAAAAAWWQGNPFPQTALGAPYLCTSCGRSITQTEGTSLIGAEMRCVDCTTRYFAPTEIPPESPPPPAQDAEPHTQRHGRRSWSLAVLAGIAVIGLVVGLVVWAPWKTKAPAIPTGDASRPVALQAVATTVDSVTLRWSPPPNSPAPDKYEIIRSTFDNALGTVPASQTSYQVTNLDPASYYSFEVVAYWGAQRSEPSVAVVAHTDTPPVADARLSGSLPVQINILESQSNIKGKKWSDTWTFSPACNTGPCAVVLDAALDPPGFTAHPFKITLNRNGAVYTGQTTAHTSHCTVGSDKVDVQDTLTVTITVNSAGTTDGAWHATSWTGSLRQDSPYTATASGHCPASSTTASLTSTAPPTASPTSPATVPPTTSAPPAAPTVVATFTGTGDQTTKPFVVGNPWRLSWTVHADTTPLVEVVDSAGKSLDIIDDITAGSGSKVEHQACTCSLKVSVYGDTTYSFTVTNGG